MIPRSISSKPVLIAGGAGFIGSSISRLLAMSGYNVVVADSLVFGSTANLAEIRSSIDFVQHDFCNQAETRILLASISPQFVISCVGDTFVTSAYLDPNRFLRNNVEANLNILTACSEIDCERVVYLSSTEIYGDRTAGPLDEDAPFDPVNSYAVTKLAADRLCHTLALERDLNVIIARIFNCYGPRETHSYVIPEIIDQLSKSDHLVMGDVQTFRDFTYVEDTARAICLLLTAAAPSGSAFNIGSNVSIKIADLVQTIAGIMGKPSFTMSVDPLRLRRREINHFRCDPTHLQQVTGWRPVVGLEEGLTKTVEWFYANGATWPWDGAIEEERPREAPLLAAQGGLYLHG